MAGVATAAAVAAGVKAGKTAESRVVSLSRIMGQLIAFFAASFFILLLLCFSVPFFLLLTY